MNFAGVEGGVDFLVGNWPVSIFRSDNNYILFTHTQELQSTRGADPQPEYYIDQIGQMTSVSISLVLFFSS